jgi:two-component system, LuxR family, response regulator FixJ
MTVPLAIADELQQAPLLAPTVFVVDDDPEVRSSLSLLARSVGLNVETFASAREFLDSYDPRRPGCLVLDVRMPGMSGLELQKQLTAQGISLSIILITAHAEIPMAIEAMRAGALDFIQKPFSRHAILERIHEAMKLGEGRHRTQLLHHEVDGRTARLSSREREVMRLLAAGDSTKIIALRLGISPKTVDNHRIKVFKKMGVDNAAQLAGLLSRVTTKRPHYRVPLDGRAPGLNAPLGVTPR